MGYPDVEGYGVVHEGEVYHPAAFFDPKEEFKNAGDIKAADKATQERLTHSEGDVIEETEQFETKLVAVKVDKHAGEQSNASEATTVESNKGTTDDPQEADVKPQFTKDPSQPDAVKIDSDEEPQAVKFDSPPDSK